MCISGTKSPKDLTAENHRKKGSAGGETDFLQALASVQAAP
jgi:hypothetical protein